MFGAYAAVVGFIGGTEPVEAVILVVVALVYAVVPAGLVYLAMSRGGDETETENGDGAADDVPTEDEGGGG